MGFMPDHLSMYRQVAGDDDRFRKYLDEWVYGVADQEAYLAKVGAVDLMRVKANSNLGYAPGLDRR